MSETSPRQGRIQRVLLAGFCTLVAVWLLLPLTLIVPISFSGENSFAFPPRTWTWERYGMLADPMWLGALGNSLLVATLVALVCSVLGTLAAFAVTRSRSRLMPLVRILVLAPQIVPVVIVGLGIYLVFLRWQLTGTFASFVIAHSALALAFVVIPVSAALTVFDTSLERASASLGAGPISTFFQVTLPVIRPALLSGALLAFLASFDELVLALFLQSPFFLTLPVLLYRRMRDVIDPTIAAVATLELACVVGGVIAALAFQSRERRGEPEPP